MARAPGHLEDRSHRAGLVGGAADPFARGQRRLIWGEGGQVRQGLPRPHHQHPWGTPETAGEPRQEATSHLLGAIGVHGDAGVLGIGKPRPPLQGRCEQDQQPAGAEGPGDRPQGIGVEPPMGVQDRDPVLPTQEASGPRGGQGAQPLRGLRPDPHQPI